MRGLREVNLLIVFIVCFVIQSFGQKAKYQSDIIFRLSQFVSWPENDKGYKFIIGVVGNENDFESFQQLAQLRGRLKDNLIEVRYFRCTDNIDNCDLLYISEECTIDIKKIVKKTKKESILIVSGKNGYGKSGSIINFVESEGKLKIELNQEQAQERGLVILDNLMEISILI